MSKLKEVLEKRIAVIDARLLAMAESKGEEQCQLEKEDSELEVLAGALYRKQAGMGTLSPEQEELAQKYGVSNRLECQQKRARLQERAEQLLGPKMAEAQRLAAEKKKLAEALPLVGMVEGALADYLPLAKDLSAELAPELADVVMVLVELYAKTGIEVWGRTQDQFAADFAKLWAKSLKIKLDALLAAGFKKNEAMQLLLANSTSPASALLQGLKNNLSRVKVKKS